MTDRAEGLQARLNRTEELFDTLRTAATTYHKVVHETETRETWPYCPDPSCVRWRAAMAEFDTERTRT